LNLTDTPGITIDKILQNTLETTTQPVVEIKEKPPVVVPRTTLL
jgi:hypothetical protein